MGTRKASARQVAGSPSDQAVPFDRGVVLGDPPDLPPFGVRHSVSIDPRSGDAADLWIVDPDEYDPARHVVLVDARVAERPSFDRWMRCDATMPHDDTPDVVVHVPEAGPGRSDAARRVRPRVDPAEVRSYVPPFTW